MRGIKFNLPYETYGSFGELGDPYKMIRVDKYFGYTYYTSDVEKDIEIAKRFDSNNIHHVNLFHKEWVYTKMK